MTERAHFPIRRMWSPAPESQKVRVRCGKCGQVAAPEWHPHQPNNPRRGLGGAGTGHGGRRRARETRRRKVRERCGPAGPVSRTSPHLPAPRLAQVLDHRLRPGLVARRQQHKLSRLRLSLAGRSSRSTPGGRDSSTTARGRSRVRGLGSRSPEGRQPNRCRSQISDEPPDHQSEACAAKFVLKCLALRIYPKQRFTRTIARVTSGWRKGARALPTKR
jgi:hypothetical protein